MKSIKNLTRMTYETASNNVQKPAKIDNGYEFQVPIFINEGDIVRIDTRTGEYSDRVSKA